MTQTPKQIYIFSPSGAVHDKAAFKWGVARLRDLGHSVEVDENALANDKGLAGTDEQRLQAIIRACQSGADVALISRGGYGLSRLLPHLPYAVIAKACKAGTRFMGLSDFTAFQLAVLAHGLAPQTQATLQTAKGLAQDKPSVLASSKETLGYGFQNTSTENTLPITYAGPSLCADFGSAEPPNETMLACFNDCVNEQALGTGWRLSAESWRHFMQWQISGSRSNKGQGDDSKSLESLTPPEDSLEGVLWGGNLSIVVSLLGTPYWPGIEQGILFLEDVNEPPWRVERLLLQLLHAGVLAQQKAVLLGQFTGYTVHPRHKGHTLQAVVDFLRPHLPCPVLCGLPFGHVPTKVVLPVGAQASLELRGKEVLLLWD